MPVVTLAEFSSGSTIAQDKESNTWKGYISPADAADTAILTTRIPKILGYHQFSFVLVAPSNYENDDIPRVSLIARGWDLNIEERYVLVPESPTPKAGDITGGKVFSAELSFADPMGILPSPRYEIEVQYSGSQNANRLGRLQYFIVGRLSGSGLGGAGSNMQLLYSQEYFVDGLMTHGLASAGATVISIAGDAAQIDKLAVGKHIVIGAENHILTAKDTVANTITIDSALKTAVSNGKQVRAGIMTGADDTLVLPGGGIYEQLHLMAKWRVETPNRVATGGDGKTTAWFYTAANGDHSSFQDSTSANYWAFGSFENSPTAKFYMGIVYTNLNHSWTLMYDPRTGTLEFEKVNSYQSTFHPIITLLTIAGR